MQAFSTPRVGQLRYVLSVAGLIGPLALLGGLSAAQQPSGTEKQTAQRRFKIEHETADQKYKNIKVLKTLPAGALIRTMREYNKALGVNCDYCHVIATNHSGFERDDRAEKETARKMILMVQDLNAHSKAIRDSASCNMCHRGHRQPAASMTDEHEGGNQLRDDSGTGH